MTMVTSAVPQSLKRGQEGRFAILMVLAFPLLIGLSGCEERPVSVPLFPPSADLAVEPKPIPPVEIATSAQAAAEYDIALESWGERGWKAVARICRWAEGHGMEVNCPPAN